MKCPLRNHDSETEGAFFGDCVEEECAWWTIPLSTTKAGRCAIRELAEMETLHKAIRTKVLDSKLKGI